MSLEERFKHEVRVIEALLFAAPNPLSRADIEAQIDLSSDFEQLIKELQTIYSGRGIELRKIGSAFAFRTTEDLGPYLSTFKVQRKRLSRAALETLAIIAYHQPVTRAEIEDVRGVQVSSGTLDVLLETGWVRMRGRRRAPGRPITYGTTPAFLDQFGFAGLDELPGLQELKGAGLLDQALPPEFEVPRPSDGAELLHDEDPLDPTDLALGAEEDPLKFKISPVVDEEG